MSLLVGFGHKARQGKDMVAGLVHQALPEHTTVMRFSGDLKSYARILGMKGKDSRFLQKLGDALRTLDQDIFVKCLAEQIVAEEPACVLIPDVRYTNEAEWIRRQGGLLVRVTRTEPNGLRYVSSDRNPDHVSETELDHYDGWGWYINVQSGDTDGLEQESRFLVGAIASRLGRSA